jgi:hypothetical protein
MSALLEFGHDEWGDSRVYDPLGELKELIKKVLSIGRDVFIRLNMEVTSLVTAMVRHVE